MQRGTGRGRAEYEATPMLEQTPRTAARTMNTGENCQNLRPVLHGTKGGETERTN